MNAMLIPGEVTLLPYIAVSQMLLGAHWYIRQYYAHLLMHESSNDYSSHGSRICRLMSIECPSLQLRLEPTPRTVRLGLRKTWTG